MITQAGPEVIEGIAAADAHAAAKISYRQLDHWARRGWVRPSIDAGVGRSGRRLYSPADVVRLALLRHLGLARVQAAVAGPAVAALGLGDMADIRILWGPIGEDAALQVVSSAQALPVVEDGGAWVVFDPAPVLARLGRQPTARPGARRSA